MEVNTDKSKSLKTSTDQLRASIELQKNIQAYIDQATAMRRGGKHKDVNYFQQFFIKAQKII